MRGKAGTGPEWRHRKQAECLEPEQQEEAEAARRSAPQAPKKCVWKEERLTQNLGGGALQGLFPDLLDGAEVHLGRLRQGCVEGVGQLSPLLQPPPPSGDPSIRESMCRGQCGILHRCLRGRGCPEGMCDVAQARGKGVSWGGLSLWAGPGAVQDLGVACRVGVQGVSVRSGRHRHRGLGWGGEGWAQVAGVEETHFDSEELKGREGLGGTWFQVCPWPIHPIGDL